jgi:hypothetical protein
MSSSVSIVPINEDVSAALQAALAAASAASSPRSAGTNLSLTQQHLQDATAAIRLRPPRSADGFGSAPPPLVLAAGAPPSELLFPCCAALRRGAAAADSVEHHQFLLPALRSVSSSRLCQAPHRVVADDAARCVLVATSVAELRAFVAANPHRYAIPASADSCAPQAQLARKSDELTGRCIEAAQALIGQFGTAQLSAVASELDAELNQKRGGGGKKAQQQQQHPRSVFVPVTDDMRREFAAELPPDAAMVEISFEPGKDKAASE